MAEMCFGRNVLGACAAWVHVTLPVPIFVTSSKNGMQIRNAQAQEVRRYAL